MGRTTARRAHADPTTTDRAVPGTSRSARTRHAVLDAARELFLTRGYVGTSTDELAARAKVSKATLYKHFGDKGALFIELLTGDMSGADDLVADLAEAVPGSEDLTADLQAFARAYLVAVMQPHLLRLRRLVIAEAERFPGLAAAWHRQGPEQAYALFAGWFTTLDQRGLLRVEDPAMAAQHFNWLVLSTPLNEAMSRPTHDDPPDPRTLHPYADHGVRAFLAAYAPPSDPPRPDRAADQVPP